MGGKKRIAVDNMIVDRIMETPGLLGAIQRAGERGALGIVATHLLRDGLAATPDPERRKRLLATFDALPKEEVPTRGFVLGVTALGGGRDRGSEGRRPGHGGPGVGDQGGSGWTQVRDLEP